MIVQIKRPESKQPIPKQAKKVFKGILFDVYQWPQQLFDGSTATFEKIKRIDTVSIFPVTEDKKIIITKQEQPGIKPFTASIGGQIEPGETPMECAKREMMEESGLEAKEIKLWYCIQPIAMLDWAIYCFIAKKIKKVQEPKLEPGERIELVYLTFREFLSAVTKPDFLDKEVTIKLLTAQQQDRNFQKQKNSFWINTK